MNQTTERLGTPMPEERCRCGCPAWFRPSYAPDGLWFCCDCGAEYEAGMVLVVSAMARRIVGNETGMKRE